MKYIRTNEGIYETSDDDYKLFMIDSFKLAFKDKYKEEIISQADTIEELCDMFVCICDNDLDTASIINAKHISINEALKYSNYEEEKENMQFYGAVWCDSGLKYVAKLNDKEELELL